MCSFLWKGHKNSLVETLQSLLNSDTLLDCTVAAEGQYLKAHKVILAASSPYFKLLFSQEQEKNPIVVLKDVNFQELKCIIEYIYKGEVEVPAGQVKSFLQTAESLQIVGLLGSVQERVNGEDEGCLSATSNSPIARKRRKHNQYEANLREKSPNEAHFSVTSETSEVSHFAAQSGQSINCSAPNFLLTENSVQENSGIRDSVQNFEAVSSETLGGNVIETKLERDNLPIVPFVSGELISSSHMDHGASNLCDSSIAPDVCDNITNQVAGQKECAVNSHCMEQQHMVFIKQDPDAVDISEERFEDGMGVGGGDFLEGNSTVDPQCGAADAPGIAAAVGETASTSYRSVRVDQGRRNRRAVYDRNYLLGSFSARISKRLSARNMEHQTPSPDQMFVNKNWNKKRYLCVDCGSSFSKSYDLIVHRRIHSGEKPFECHYCQKRFTQKSHLVGHVRIHTGDKPYKCVVCGKTFTFQGSLKCHERSYHDLNALS